MPTRKTHTQIPPSDIEYENTGVFTSLGRTFKVVGFDLKENKADVKNDRGEYRLMTNQEIATMAATP